jgi:LmbE family N-acetylglucosaminyl deacetylase
MKKIISIGSHPDDVEQGMGGSLAKHSDKGDEVHIILCTLGGVSGEPKIREEEAQMAARILNADLHVLDYPVYKLNKPSIEFSKIISKVLEEMHPYRVYTHSPFDYHQVHAAVSESVITAAIEIGQLLFYEDISSTDPQFRPNAYVDITEYIDLKIKSLDAHRTQLSKSYLQSNVLRSLASTRYFMSKIGLNPNGMAEAFTIHKFIV